jgi:hypothetical protein
MGWNKDGSTIKAEYCGTTFTGVVLESRVKYGGKVQYQVKADMPFYVDVLRANREIVLVDEDEVLVDFGILMDLEAL